MFAKWAAGCMGGQETEGSGGDSKKEDNPFPEPPLKTPYHTPIHLLIHQSSQYLVNPLLRNDSLE